MSLPSPVRPLAGKSDTSTVGRKVGMLHLGQPPGWGMNRRPTKLAKRQFSGTVPFSSEVFPKPWGFFSLSFFCTEVLCHSSLMELKIGTDVTSGRLCIPFRIFCDFSYFINCSILSYNSSRGATQWSTGKCSILDFPTLRRPPLLLPHHYHQKIRVTDSITTG